MKKIMYSDLNSLGSILDSYIQNDNTALRDAMKNTTLFKFWDKVVGKKFESVSKPVSLSQKTGNCVLNVACANASVTNELMMFKLQLIKKFNTYANPLGVNIEDINFSHKIWQVENSKSFQNNIEVQEENPYKEDLNGFNPDDIELTGDEIGEIENNLSKNMLLSDEQKQRLFKSIVFDLKVKKWQGKDL